MIPEITLRRPVAVSCWRVVGQIAKATKRAELVPLLLRVRDQDLTDANDIAEHLFFESRSRKVVAERLLRIAATYRLLENDRGWFTLTDEGREAIESEQVFVPKYGTWTIWASNDPLLGSRVLRVEPWQEPSAYDEVWGKDRDAKREFRPLPSWLKDVVGRVLRPCAGDGHNLRVDELEPEGEPVEPDTNLSTEWAVAARRLWVTGQVGAKPVHTDLAPPQSLHAEVWHELLEHEGLWSIWDPTKEALIVGFDDTKDVERELMARTLRIERPRLEGLGMFSSIAVSGVRLAPRTLRDAERWARWRLESRVQDYATQDRMEEWTRAAKEPFADLRIELPDRYELARVAWSAPDDPPSPRTWHLVAAEDWSL